MIGCFRLRLKGHRQYQCKVFSITVKVSFKNKLKTRAKYVKHDD